MKKLSKLMSLVLALAMCLSLLPATALAAESTDQTFIDSLQLYKVLDSSSELMADNQAVVEAGKYVGFEWKSTLDGLDNGSCLENEGGCQIKGYNYGGPTWTTPSGSKIETSSRMNGVFYINAQKCSTDMEEYTSSLTLVLKPSATVKSVLPGLSDTVDVTVTVNVVPLTQEPDPTPTEPTIGKPDVNGDTMTITVTGDPDAKVDLTQTIQDAMPKGKEIDNTSADGGTLVGNVVTVGEGGTVTITVTLKDKTSENPPVGDYAIELTGPDTVSAGQTVEVTVKVTGGEFNAINGDLTVTWDGNVFEDVTATPIEGITSTPGTNSVALTRWDTSITDAIDGSSGICTLSLKVKANVANNTPVTITASDASIASFVDKDFATGSSSNFQTVPGATKSMTVQNEISVRIIAEKNDVDDTKAVSYGAEQDTVLANIAEDTEMFTFESWSANPETSVVDGKIVAPVTFTAQYEGKPSTPKGGGDDPDNPGWEKPDPDNNKYGEPYVGYIPDYEPDKYDYTVHYTNENHAEEVTFTNADEWTEDSTVGGFVTPSDVDGKGKFMIPTDENLPGLTIWVTKTTKGVQDVTIIQNFAASGVTMVLVEAEASNNYTYDGEKMFYIDNSSTQGFVYLVKVPEGGSLTEADAAKKVAAVSGTADTLEQDGKTVGDKLCADDAGNFVIAFQGYAAAKVDSLSRDMVKIYLKLDMDGNQKLDLSDLQAILTELSK